MQNKLTNRFHGGMILKKQEAQATVCAVFVLGREQWTVESIMPLTMSGTKQPMPGVSAGQVIPVHQSSWK
jgi:hypothetical protein